MHILLAEDDLKLGKLIVHMLKKNQHSVDWVQDGEAAYDYALTVQYDTMILDWMMPKLDGVQVCKRLRNRQYNGAILMLTAKDSVDDRVYGLDAGADDYLVKPFEFPELFARLRALSRRSASPVSQDIVEVSDLKLNRTTRMVEKSGQVIQLTPKEYQLLELLMVNAGQTLPRELIIDRIWGYSFDVSDNNLDALVRLLRKKVDQQEPRLIHSVRGVGYKLEI